MKTLPKFVAQNWGATPELSFHETEAEAISACGIGDTCSYVYTLIDDSTSYYMSHTRSNDDSGKMWHNSSDAIYALVECSSDDTPYWEFCEREEYEAYKRSVKHWHKMECIYRPAYE